jgi:hypothetical protein
VCGQVFRRLVSRAHGSWSVRTTEPHGRVSGSQSKKAGSPGNFRARQDRREASVSAAPRAIVMARIERDKNETIQVYLLFIHSSVYIYVYGDLSGGCDGSAGACLMTGRGGGCRHGGSCQP